MSLVAMLNGPSYIPVGQSLFVFVAVQRRIRIGRIPNNVLFTHRPTREESIGILLDLDMREVGASYHALEAVVSNEITGAIV